MDGWMIPPSVWRIDLNDLIVTCVGLLGRKVNVE
jgi:hypothetical protein